MSTSAVSSSSLNQQIQQYFHTRQTDLHDLGQALGTGDLANAQTEYNNIAQLGQSGPFASGNAFSNSTREADFTAIGTALQSGNLAAAQPAFSDLKSTFQNSNGGQAASSSAAGSSSVGPAIIINIGNNGSQTASDANPILTAAPTGNGGLSVTA
jgi:hypothetical protein